MDTYFIDIESKNDSRVPPTVLYTLCLEAEDSIHAGEQALERIREDECIGKIGLRPSQAAADAVMLRDILAGRYGTAENPAPGSFLEEVTNDLRGGDYPRG